jgi:dCTP deaminase
VYLPNRDLKYAVESGLLVVDPPPKKYDLTGIDLHLDHIREAKIWDVAAFEAAEALAGHKVAMLGAFPDYKTFATKYAIDPPLRKDAPDDAKVYRDKNSLVIEPGGFALWLTKEVVGTREDYARYICFINGKSSRARTGLVVHLTAPTIHAGWWGKVTLELANLGPFRLSLEEGDAIAQIVVAAVTSPPEKSTEVRGIASGQKAVTGSTRSAAKRRRGGKK